MGLKVFRRKLMNIRGINMVKMKEYSARICLAAIIIGFATPLTSTGNEASGQDWYCSNPKTHATYEVHLRKHIDHSAEAITERLDEIFNNGDLSREEKKAKTIDLLHKHLAKMELGTGD